MDGCMCQQDKSEENYCVDDICNIWSVKKIWQQVLFEEKIISKLFWSVNEAFLCIFR